MRAEKETFGANIGAVVRVRCRVDRYCTVLYCTVLHCTVDSWPAPASFSWGFNNSKDAVKLGRELYSVAGHQEQADYFYLLTPQFNKQMAESC